MQQTNLGEAIATFWKSAVDLMSITACIVKYCFAVADQLTPRLRKLSTCKYQWQLAVNTVIWWNKNKI